MKDYENVVAELKQQLQESELQRQHQVKVGLGPQNAERTLSLFISEKASS